MLGPTTQTRGCGPGDPTGRLSCWRGATEPVVSTASASPASTVAVSSERWARPGEALAHDRPLHPPPSRHGLRLLSRDGGTPSKLRRLGHADGVLAMRILVRRIEHLEAVAIQGWRSLAAVARMRCSRSRGRCSAPEQDADHLREVPLPALPVRDVGGAAARKEPRPLDEVRTGRQRAHEAVDLRRFGRPVRVQHDDDVAASPREPRSAGPRPCPGASACTTRMSAAGLRTAMVLSLELPSTRMTSSTSVGIRGRTPRQVRRFVQRGDHHGHPRLRRRERFGRASMGARSAGFSNRTSLSGLTVVSRRFR